MEYEEYWDLRRAADARPGSRSPGAPLPRNGVDVMTAPPPPPAPLSGRRAEAARNDARILEAAREVFLSDPGAPIAAVAERAGVGVASLYRRYPSKEHLLQRLFLESNRRTLALAEATVAEGGEPWEVFSRFLHRRLDSGEVALSFTIPVTFSITDEHRAIVQKVRDLMQILVDRAQDAGALRPDVEIGDLTWLFIPLQAIETGNPIRNRELRHRHLAILLDGLRTGSTAPLPGPPPGWDEFGEFWEEVVPVSPAAKRP
jgi:AcrR family transcriptional regulator